MSKQKRFVLKLNEEQLQVVQNALEEYCRIRMNQWWDLADSLASQHVDFSPENPRHDEIFKDFIHRRDSAKEVLECAGRILWGKYSYYGDPKTEDQLIAEDIWRVIRYARYLESGRTDTDTVDSYPPIIVSNEPKPICEEEKQ